MMVHTKLVIATARKKTQMSLQARIFLFRVAHSIAGMPQGNMEMISSIVMSHANGEPAGDAGHRVNYASCLLTVVQ